MNIFIFEILLAPENCEKIDVIIAALENKEIVVESITPI